MSSRGVYRGIFSALPDDPDFQRLPPSARLVFYTVRLCKQAGPAAIFRYYPVVLAEQTGLAPKALEAALVALERGAWIEREGVILWVRNGLRYDPSVRLSDPKHRKAIERHLAELPKLDIVLRFCDYYQFARPFEGPSKTYPNLALREGDRDREGDREGDRDRIAPAPAVAPATGPAWEAYASAYKRRYQAEPVRNAKVNSQLKAFVARLEAEDAPAVAAFYVGHNAGRYVRAGHPVGLLLYDAEKLRTEWATGRRITETGARHADQHQERGGIAQRLLERADEESRHGV